MNEDKFIYDPEYQWEIIKYIVLDRDGYKALQLVEPEYFSLVEQQVIVAGLKKFFKKKQRVPKNVANFKQEVKLLFRTRKYAQNLKSEDKENILKKISSIFRSKLRDAEDIFEECKKFASFVNVKKLMEEVDITNFDSYQSHIDKFQRAINVGIELDEERGEFIIAGVKNRQHRRKMGGQTNPTPIKQFNNLTNAGGVVKGSLITILDKAKGGKTVALVNIGIGYMKQRKKVIVFDLENGQDSYSFRYDQSLANETKKSILSGEHDDKLYKTIRKYQRMGAEVLIKRMPAGTTAQQMDTYLQEVYRDTGLKFDAGIIDYIAIMGSNDGEGDETKRISKAYLDVKNLAEKWGWEAVWTGHHVVRDAIKRRPTCYEANDTAKAIDIHRHVDVLLGINQSPEEEAAGVCRWEIIDQRDGVGEGRVYFWLDISKQRMVEFNKTQIQAYREQLSNQALSAPKGRGQSKKGTKTDL